MTNITCLRGTDRVNIHRLHQLTPAAASRIISKSHQRSLRHLLHSAVSPDAPKATTTRLLLGTQSNPSQRLLAITTSRVQRHRRFILLSRRELTCRLILRTIRSTQTTSAGAIVIIDKNPNDKGDIVTLSLLKRLTQRNQSILRTAKSHSFAGALHDITKRQSQQARTLFGCFGSFVSTREGDLSILVVSRTRQVQRASIGQ